MSPTLSLQSRLEQISQLMKQVEQAKAEQDFETAFILLDQLERLKTLNVIIGPRK
jgi:excinuclease UvrABC nuclease subunit